MGDDFNSFVGVAEYSYESEIKTSPRPTDTPLRTRGEGKGSPCVARVLYEKPSSTPRCSKWRGEVYFVNSYSNSAMPFCGIGILSLPDIFALLIFIPSRT